MPIRVKCPACHAPIPQLVEYEAKVTCELCAEVFTAPAKPEPIPEPQPQAQPTPAVAPTVVPVQPQSAPNPIFDFTPEPEPDDEDGPPTRAREQSKTRERQRQKNREGNTNRRGWITTKVFLTTFVLAIFLGCMGIMTYNDFIRPAQPLLQEILPPPRNTDPIPMFDAPKIPFQPGTQVRLREVRAFAAPALPVVRTKRDLQLVYSSRHRLLFFRDPTGVTVYDVSQPAPTETRLALKDTSEMSLAPEQTVLYLGEIKAKRIHQFDLATRTWAQTSSPAIPRRLHAVDSNRVLVIPNDSSKLELLQFTSKSPPILLSTYDVMGLNDSVYRATVGKIYFTGLDQFLKISVLEPDLGNFKLSKQRGTWTTDRPVGGTLCLSPDGESLYYGRAQFNPDNFEQTLRVFNEPIFACSRDLAFSATTVYRASDGSMIQKMPCRTTSLIPTQPTTITEHPAMVVSPDGLTFWVLDLDGKLLREFAIEGDPE